MVRIPDLTQLYRVNSNHFHYFACFYLHYRLRSRAKRNGFKFSSGKSIYYREIINKRIRCTESGLNDLILAVEHIARVSRKNQCKLTNTNIRIHINVLYQIAHSNEQMHGHIYTLRIFRIKDSEKISFGLHSKLDQTVKTFDHSV